MHRATKTRLLAAFIVTSPCNAELVLDILKRVVRIDFFDGAVARCVVVQMERSATTATPCKKIRNLPAPGRTGFTDNHRVCVRLMTGSAELRVIPRPVLSKVKKPLVMPDMRSVFKLTERRLLGADVVSTARRQSRYNRCHTSGAGENSPVVAHANGFAWRAHTYLLDFTPGIW